MSTSARAELSVINSVQINSSSQSIAGTLRAPKSSLLAMAVIPLPRGTLTATLNPGSGFRGSRTIFLTWQIALWVRKARRQGYDQSSDTARE